MTSAQARRYAHQVIKNDPQAIRPLILMIYGFKESRGDPAGDDLLTDVLAELFLQTGQWEEMGLKEYVSSLAA